MGFMGKHHRIRPANLCAALRSMTISYLTATQCGASGTWLLLALGVSACASNPIGIQGRWIGTVKPVSGSCDPASQATLNIESGRTPPYTAIFTPTDGVLALHGKSDGIGQVTADLHTVGMNHQPYALAFNGTRDGDLIRGTYTTPRCRSNVELERK